MILLFLTLLSIFALHLGTVTSSAGSADVLNHTYIGKDPVYKNFGVFKELNKTK